MLSILVLLFACSQDWTCNLKMIVTKKLREPMPITVMLSDDHLDVVNITMKIKTLVWKPWMIKIKKHLKKAGEYIVQNVAKITIKMKTTVWKPWMIKIIKLRLRNSDNYHLSFPSCDNLKCPLPKSCNLVNQFKKINDFNGILTCLGLFYTERLGNHIHCTFIFCVFVSELFFTVLLNSAYTLVCLGFMAYQPL